MFFSIESRIKLKTLLLIYNIILENFAEHLEVFGENQRFPEPRLGNTKLETRRTNSSWRGKVWDWTKFEKFLQKRKITRMREDSKLICKKETGQ